MTTPLIECVPNVSEGRNPEIIKTIADAITSIPNVMLLNIDSGISANRTVYTFIGEVNAVFEAAFQIYKTALELIDMSKHQGSHPRIGAVDVCPFVAWEGITDNELIPKVAQFAHRVGNELGIAGYFYEKNARSNLRSNLANIRKGEYEGLQEKLKQRDWRPDFGSIHPNTISKFGVTVIGTRGVLVAYNVNLLDKDDKIANEIAYEIRELGKIVPAPGGGFVRIPGLLKSVKAIGWYIPEFNLSQVSFNLVDISVNGMGEVYLLTETLARRRGIELKGSELVGMVPISEILRSSRYIMERKFIRNINEYSEEMLVQKAVELMGLDKVKPFDPDEHIIEYKIKKLNYKQQQSR